MDGTTLLIEKVLSFHEACGGERAFWRAWLDGKVDDEDRDEYRRAADELAGVGESQWLRDLESLETDAARTDLDRAVEIATYLVDKPCGTDTGSALYGRGLSLKDRVHAGVLDLLKWVEVELPTDRENAIGSELLRHVTGSAAMARFKALLNWLADIRRRMARSAQSEAVTPANLSLIEWYFYKLFLKNHSGTYKFNISYRLYLRQLLLEYCRKQRLPCRHPGGLQSAFTSLDRERIGKTFDKALIHWSTWPGDPTAKEICAFDLLRRDMIAIS